MMIPMIPSPSSFTTDIIGISIIIIILYTGALDYVDDVQTFTWLCFLVRIAEALGSCAFSTASYVYIMHHFGDQLGWTFGVLETFVGLGMSLGPGIGGGLYGLGGYALPFYLLGLITLINLPFAWMVLPLLGNVMETSEKSSNILHPKKLSMSSLSISPTPVIKTKPGATQSCEYSPMDWPSNPNFETKHQLKPGSTDIWRIASKTYSTSADSTCDGGYSAGSSSISVDYGSLNHHSKEDVSRGPVGAEQPNRKTSFSGGRRRRLSYQNLLRMPQVLLICLVIIVISQSQGFLDPTIEPHLRRYGLRPSLVGLIFLLMSAAYALTSPLIGWWSSRSQNKLAIMAFGCFITWIGLTLVGPSRLTRFEPSILFR